MIPNPKEELPLTPHEIRVRTLNRAFGNPLPCVPTTPIQKEFLRQFRLIFEEVLELAEAGGVVIRSGAIDGEVSREYASVEISAKDKAVDLSAVTDAVADISVTNTGMAALCGVALTPILEEVDANNFGKIARGKRNPETGKWMKPENHPKPSIDFLLRMQGWQQEK